MLSNKKVLKNIDYNILFSVVAVVIIGLITISSATHAFKDDGSARLFITQIAWFIIACTIGCALLLIDYNTIGGYYKVLYTAIVAMLVLVLLVGSVRNGAKAWLGVGSLGIQPSEFAKLITIITLAKLLEDMENINTVKNLGKLAFFALLPMALIQLQPDTGTNLIFAVTIFGMLFVAGLHSKIIYSVLGSATGAIALIWQLDILKPYQKDRILVFLKPEMDKLGVGYNAIVAKTAIGSGKFFGTGLYNGTLTEGKFIPELHTDFIFSVFGEEWGFLGAMLLLALYFNIIWKCIKIAKTSKDKFGFYLVTGVLTMFTFQILQNIGMDIGLMPITGIPLPFMSYGGSSLLTSVLSMALILNVGMRRQKINF
jgi:rod shape determining protein RodA